MWREINAIEYYYFNIDVLSSIFNEKDMLILNERQTGKTILTIILLYKYLNESNKTKSVCILSHDKNIIDRIFKIGHYLNNEFNAKLLVDGNIVKSYRSSFHFLNRIRQMGEDNIIIIDEFFSYHQISSSSFELREILHLSSVKKSKLLLNTSPLIYGDEYTIDILKNEHDFFVADKNILNNLNMYNKKMKLNKIINNINDKKHYFIH